jgi:hypothetical protein
VAVAATSDGTAPDLPFALGDGRGSPDGRAPVYPVITVAIIVVAMDGSRSQTVLGRATARRRTRCHMPLGRLAVNGARRAGAVPVAGHCVASRAGAARRGGLTGNMSRPGAAPVFTMLHAGPAFFLAAVIVFLFRFRRRRDAQAQRQHGRQGRREISCGGRFHRSHHLGSQVSTPLLHEVFKFRER